MRFSLALVCALATTVSGCASAITYDYKREPDPRSREYVIGSGDSLRIAVWKNPDLTTDATVRPDGNVSIPLIGDLVAAGTTPSELRAIVQKKLAEFIHDQSAVVTVAITAVRSYSFTVNGNVEHPGVFTPPPYVTVNDALALAGGPNRFAGSRLVLVRRDPAGGVRRIPIDHQAVAAGLRPAGNLVVLPGDSLYIE